MSSATGSQPALPPRSCGLAPALRAGRRARRGHTVTEVAFVLPIVLTLVLGMFDFCRAIMMRQLLTNAAREAARQAVTNTSNMSTTAVQAVVTYAMGGQSFSNVTILVYQANPVTGANIGPWASAPTGSSIAVDVTATYTPMLSLFSLLPKTISMHTRAIMTSEAI